MERASDRAPGRDLLRAALPVLAVVVVVHALATEPDPGIGAAALLGAAVALFALLQVDSPVRLVTALG